MPLPVSLTRAVVATLPLFVLTLAPLSAYAQTAALNFTGRDTNATQYDTTRGYAFNVTGAGFNVTYLSIFDDSADGLLETHSVGLWDPSGTLLTSAVIPAGTTAPLDNTGKFRFVNVAPVFLASGNGYTVGATFLNESRDLQAAFRSFSMADNLSYAGARYVNNTAPGVLVRPTDFSPFGLTGGSFGGTAVAPEPRSIALLLTAGIPVVGIVRRRAKSRS